MGESIFADYIAATPMPNPAEAAEILFDGLEKASSLSSSTIITKFLTRFSTNNTILRSL